VNTTEPVGGPTSERGPTLEARAHIRGPIRHIAVPTHPRRGQSVALPGTLVCFQDVISGISKVECRLCSF
jgi:hypothetical protein